MAFKTKRSGVNPPAYSTPNSGTVKVAATVSGTKAYYTADRIYVASGGNWVDSGYRGRPAPITQSSVTSVGTGDSPRITFSWNAPTGGATPATYQWTQYRSTDYSVVSTALVNHVAGTTTYSKTFDLDGGAGTGYYFRVLSRTASGVTSTSGPVWGVVKGYPSTSSNVYGYSTTVTWVKPTLVQVSSQDGGAGSNMLDNSDSTIWGTVSHENPGTSLEWEGVMLGAPASIPAGADGSPPQLWGLRMKHTHYYGRIYIGVGTGTSSSTATWLGTETINSLITVPFPDPVDANNYTTWYTGQNKRYLKFYPLVTDPNPLQPKPISSMPVDGSWFVADLAQSGGSRLTLSSNMFFHVVFGPEFNAVYGSNLYGVNMSSIELGYLPKILTGTTSTGQATANSVQSIDPTIFPVPVPPT